MIYSPRNRLVNLGARLIAGGDPGLKRELIESWACACAFNTALLKADGLPALEAHLAAAAGDYRALLEGLLVSTAETHLREHQPGVH